VRAHDGIHEHVLLWTRDVDAADRVQQFRTHLAERRANRPDPFRPVLPFLDALQGTIECRESVM